MLWDASALNGYAIEASDGTIGTVNDLLFDDVGWFVRWLVVDTGNWLPGRKVLLPVSALGQPDQTLHVFPVNLTRQQVEHSPDIDTDLPVSRQIEAHVYDYYGWAPYWSGGFLPASNAIATPLVAPSFLSQAMPPGPGGAAIEADEGDPHLRSVADITGYHIDAMDGEIGHAEDFLVDDATWRIHYIHVDTDNWWPGENVLISPRSVREIGWSDRLIHLDVTRQKVKDAPSYDQAVTVDGTYHEKFLTYYGIKWVSA